MWAIVPAAGIGQRIQPIACSKELLPVGCRTEGARKRPKAVSEYLLERLILGGATRIVMVISPEKTDILQYYGGSFAGVPIVYLVQSTPRGLADALFQAVPLLPKTGDLLFGLPDTIWFPARGLADLPDGQATLLLFPVEFPQHFDAVRTDGHGLVREIQVKVPEPATHWIWGAGRLPAPMFHDLYDLWIGRERRDEYLGTLLNAYLARGGELHAVKSGRQYLDVGTYDGYQTASRTARVQAESTTVLQRP
jgi:glucose-1-phosphate thymidylyltransferase